MSRAIYRSCPSRYLVLLLLLTGCVRFERAEMVPFSLPVSSPIRSTSLVQTDRGLVLSWLAPGKTGGYTLRYSQLFAEGWGEVHSVVSGGGIWSNRFDTPGMGVFPDGGMLAYWLVRTGDKGQGYQISISTKAAGGSWGEPFSLHQAGVEAQHGFVAMAPISRDKMQLLWLEGSDGNVELRTRSVDSKGILGPEKVIDHQTCSCCRVVAKPLPDGGVLAAYRDRTAHEVRDIRRVRLSNLMEPLGAGWDSADAWKINACPINGPDLVSQENSVALAWYTAANSIERVYLALSTDGGVSFSRKIRVDAGNPLGRPSLLFGDSGRLLVAWLERDGSGALLLLRVVEPDGAASTPQLIARLDSGFLSPYPKLTTHAGRILIFWQDGGAARMVELRSLPQGLNNK